MHPLERHEEAQNCARCPKNYQVLTDAARAPRIALYEESQLLGTRYALFHNLLHINIGKTHAYTNDILASSTTCQCSVEYFMLTLIWFVFFILSYIVILFVWKSSYFALVLLISALFSLG